MIWVKRISPKAKRELDKWQVPYHRVGNRWCINSGARLSIPEGYFDLYYKIVGESLLLEEEQAPGKLRLWFLK